MDGTLLFREDFGGNDANDPVAGTDPAPGMTSSYTQIFDTATCIAVWPCTGMSNGRYLLTKTGYRNSASYTYSHWFIMDDHTYPNDYTRGYLLEIDGRTDNATLFETIIDGLCEGCKLTFSAYVVNITTSYSYDHGNNGNPQLSFMLADPETGVEVAPPYITGPIPVDRSYQNMSGEWRYSAHWNLVGMNFTVPSGRTAIKLIIKNACTAADGNDFAIDDIEIRLCAPPVTIEGETEVCEGATTSLTAKFINDGTFSEPLEYKWWFSADSLTWTEKETVTGDGLRVTAVQKPDAGWYKVAVAGAGNIERVNSRAVSEPFRLTVKECEPPKEKHCMDGTRGLFLSWDATEVPDSVRRTNPERLAYPTAMEGQLPTIYCDGDQEEIGLFSVSGTRKVAFSPGNLQWTSQGTHRCADGTVHPGTWRFAPNQWEAIGEDNTNISETYTGWIDLFGWGTSDWSGSGTTQYHPWSSASKNNDWKTSNSSMSGAYKWCDWGQYNDIKNVWGTDSAGSWYTLNQGQWQYLFTGRKNAEQLYGRGRVAGVPGMILLPDEWELPDGLSFQSGQATTYTSNIYTIRQWRTMEHHGAVFLPAASYRSPVNNNTLLPGGAYHSSTGGTNYWQGSMSCCIYFTEGMIQYVNNAVRNEGRSVRLVRNKVRNRVFPVGGGRYIRFAPGNLQYSTEGSHLCADGTTKPGTWRFAPNQWEASSEGWRSTFGWGTSGFNGREPTQSSSNNADYVWGLVDGELVHGDIDTTYYDWGAYNPIGNDAPGTWRTITMSEFDAVTRGNSLQGLATVNGIEGHIFLPEEWDLPEGLTWTGLPQDYTVNVYTLEEWQRMEANGAVFFPKTSDWGGTYWTATGAVNGRKEPVPSMAVDIFFSTFYYNINRNNGNRYGQNAVRLVQYVK